MRSMDKPKGAVADGENRMTTIAWDGNMLAGDRRVCFGQGYMGQTTKIARRDSDGALFGSSGSTSICQALQRWFIAGEVGDLPKLEVDKDNAASGFIVRSCGAIDDITALGVARILAKLYARGSGADYALGAMSMGADARRAVEVAAQWDSGTGDGVDTLLLRPDYAALTPHDLQTRVAGALRKGEGT